MTKKTPPYFLPTKVCTFNLIQMYIRTINYTFIQLFGNFVCKYQLLSVHLEQN